MRRYQFSPRVEAYVQLMNRRQMLRDKINGAVLVGSLIITLGLVGGVEHADEQAMSLAASEAVLSVGNPTSVFGGTIALNGAKSFVDEPQAATGINVYQSAAPAFVLQGTVQYSGEDTN